MNTAAQVIVFKSLATPAAKSTKNRRAIASVVCLATLLATTFAVARPPRNFRRVDAVVVVSEGTATWGAEDGADEGIEWASEVVISAEEATK